MTPVVVRASVRARLLGVPLLHLDADVVVQPVEPRAVVVVEPAVVPARPAIVPDGTLTDATALLADANRTLARAR